MRKARPYGRAHPAPTLPQGETSTPTAQGPKAGITASQSYWLYLDDRL